MLGWAATKMLTGFEVGVRVQLVQELIEYVGGSDVSTAAPNSGQDLPVDLRGSSISWGPKFSYAQWYEP